MVAQPGSAPAALSLHRSTMDSVDSDRGASAKRRLDAHGLERGDSASQPPARKTAIVEEAVQPIVETVHVGSNPPSPDAVGRTRRTAAAIAKLVG